MTSRDSEAGPPLVSLIVFAYGQERYIGEAISGALAQDYSNLEIILSDDCSLDETFVRMQSAKRQYIGPHHLVARQNERNLGLFGHFLAAIHEARGDLIVVAAGDDHSLPTRVSRLVEVWQESGALALGSYWLEMDDQSRLTGSGVKEPLAPGNIVWQFFEDCRDRQFISGQVAAYDRRFLARLPPTDARIFHEDSLLTFLGTAWSLPYRIVPAPLLHYRVHNASYSNHRSNLSGLKSSLAQDRLTARYAAANASYMRYARTILTYDPPSPLPLCKVDWARFDHILTEREIESGWLNRNMINRIGMAFSQTSPELRTKAMHRILPMTLFSIIKHAAGPARRVLEKTTSKP